MTLCCQGWMTFGITSTTKYHSSLVRLARGANEVANRRCEPHLRYAMGLYSSWVRGQVIFDVLLRKGDLVEKFVAFANKPRLLQRFRERLADYKRFWQGVQVGSWTREARGMWHSGDGFKRCFLLLFPELWFMAGDDMPYIHRAFHQHL